MTQNPNDGKWRAAFLKETQKQIWGLLFHWAFFQMLEKGGFHGRGQSEFTLKPCFYSGKAIQYERTLLNQQSGNLGLIWGNHHKLLFTCFLTEEDNNPSSTSFRDLCEDQVNQENPRYVYVWYTSAQVRVSGKS